MIGLSRTVPGAAVVVSAVLVLSAVPARADAAAVRDPAGDSRKAADLLRLQVRHDEPTAPRQLVLRALHDGLPSFASGTATTVTFWIDTDRRDQGPEYVYDLMPNRGGLELSWVRGWARRGERVQPCPGLRARADVFSDAPVLVKVPRGCIGAPRRARAAVLSVGRTVRGKVVGRDWVGGRRHWSPWVRR